MHSCDLAVLHHVFKFFLAEYFNTGYSNKTVITPLIGISDTKYWDISKKSGADAIVRLSLTSAVTGAAAANGIVAAHYMNGQWTSAHGTVLTPGNVASGAVLTRPVSNFSPFTFGIFETSKLQKDTTAATGPGLNYKYYEGAFTVLPDFSTLIPVKTGNTSNIDLNIRRSGINDTFAIVWEGYINIKTPGTYFFKTVSDDGSKLYFNSLYAIGAPALVNNDGIHSPTTYRVR